MYRAKYGHKVKEVDYMWLLMDHGDIFVLVGENFCFFHYLLPWGKLYHAIYIDPIWRP